MSLREFAETHEVFNQVPPLDGAYLYAIDLPLREWAAGSDAFLRSRLAPHGRVCGTLPRGVDVSALLARSSPQSA